MTLSFDTFPSNDWLGLSFDTSPSNDWLGLSYDTTPSNDWLGLSFDTSQGAMIGQDCTHNENSTATKYVISELFINCPAGIAYLQLIDNIIFKC